MVLLQKPIIVPIAQMANKQYSKGIARQRGQSIGYPGRVRPGGACYYPWNSLTQLLLNVLITLSGDQGGHHFTVCVMLHLTLHVTFTCHLHLCKASGLWRVQGSKIKTVVRGSQLGCDNWPHLQAWNFSG